MCNYVTRNIPTNEEISNRKNNISDARDIMSKNISDYEKVILLSRICPSPKKFKSNFHYFTVMDKKYAEENKDLVMDVYNLLMDYKNNGKLDKILFDKKFLFGSQVVKDAREVIIDYITDFESYKTKEFYEKHSISGRDEFESCKKKIEKYAPNLWAKFIEAEKINNNKKLIMPIYYLSEIKQGIECGTTSKGDSFDIYEFWRLNPFKTKSIENEIKKLKKIHPGFEKISILNSELYKELNKEKDEKEKISLGYKDFLCNFVEVLGFDKEHSIKNYMEENNIKSCKLLNRDDIIKELNSYNYYNLSIDDINNILDFMDSENIPYVKDCFDKASKDYVDQLSLSKNTRKLLKYNMVDRKEE